MPGKLGKYKLYQTLGKGQSCKVKLGVEENTGNQYAVKIINDDMSKDHLHIVMNELETMVALEQHQNLITIIESGKDTYHKQSGKQKEVNFIVLELATGGEIYDIVAMSGKFTEDLARYIFKQMLEGLDYLHKQGFAHRDLKAENILLDQNTTVKIADFGFAGPIQGRDNKGFLDTYLGTLYYMAPEIHLHQKYDGRSVDLFAIGIVLFIMVAEHPPFTTAQSSDPFYKMIASNRADLFWKYHSKNKPNQEKFFSDELKDLVQSMLQLQSAHRPSISEILAHDWMKGNVPDATEIAKEFSQRDSVVKQQHKKSDSTTDGSDSNETMRSFFDFPLDQIQQFKDVKPLKDIQSAQMPVKQQAFQTQFVSSLSPDLLSEAIVLYINKEVDTKIVVHETKYKFKFEINHQESSNQEPETQISTLTKFQIQLLQIDSEQIAIQFIKEKGSKARFHNEYNKFKQAFSFANNVKE